VSEASVRCYQWYINFVYATYIQTYMRRNSGELTIICQIHITSGLHQLKLYCW